MGTEHLKSGVIALALALAMAVTGSLRADEQQESGRKGKGSKAEVVEVDLFKLPHDLAEQVLKALSKKKGKQDGSGKMGKGPNKDQYTKKG